MSRRRSRAGVALILALLVVTILTITVVPFVYDGRVEQAVAANLYTSLQASYLATGGVVLAEAVLRDDLKTDASGNQRVDYLGERWARLASVPIAAGGGGVQVVISDERGKLPLSAVAQGAQTAQWRAALQRLLIMVAKVEAGEAEGLMEALVDWVDPPNEVTGSGGAEDAYDQSLDPPGEAADAPLQTVAELRLIRGWTGKIVDAIAPFLTVYPPNAAQINPNTAPREVLVAIGLDESQADSAEKMREDQPFRSVDDLRNRTGINTANIPPLVFQSEYFGVTSTGGFRDSVYIVRAVLQRRQAGPAVRHYWRAE
jgi:general secretion pathway protein K